MIPIKVSQRALSQHIAVGLSAIVRVCRTTEKLIDTRKFAPGYDSGASEGRPGFPSARAPMKLYEELIDLSACAKTSRLLPISRSETDIVHQQGHSGLTEWTSRLKEEDRNSARASNRSLHAGKDF